MERCYMKNKRKYALTAIVFLFLLAWVVLVVIHLHDFANYKYLQIGFWTDFIDLLFWLFLLPIILVSLILVIGIKGKKNLVVLALLSFGILAVVFVRVLGNGLYRLPFFSFSADVSDFGTYDKTVEAQIGAYPESGFPHERVRGAKDTQFLYWFYDASSTHYCVMVSWEFNIDAEFQDEINRLIQCGYSIEHDQIIYLMAPQYKGFASEVMIDWEEQRIVYFFFSSSDENAIPQTLDEYYSIDYSKEYTLDLIG